MEHPEEVSEHDDDDEFSEDSEEETKDPSVIQSLTTNMTEKEQKETIYDPKEVAEEQLDKRFFIEPN